MNDFFGFTILIQWLVPVVLIVMLAKLIARQALYRDEARQALHEGRPQLKALLQQLAGAPLALLPPPTIFAALGPTAGIALSEISSQAIVVPKAQAAESADASNWLPRIGTPVRVTGLGFFLEHPLGNSLPGGHAGTALLVLALVAWKVPFINLACLEQIHRVAVFIILDMLALGGAFSLMLFQQSFIRTIEKE